jgi:cell shape-determining protein MreD
MEDRDTNWISVIIYWALCYLAIYFEATVEIVRQILTVQIDLLPGLIVYAGLRFPLYIIVISGGVFGLLFDSLSANPPGTTTIALTAVGFVIYQFRELLLSDQITAHLVLGMIGSAVAPLISLIVLFGVGEQPMVRWTSIFQWLILSTGGGLATPLWFKLFNRFDTALRYKKAPEGGFRPDREIVRGRNW